MFGWAEILWASNCCSWILESDSGVQPWLVSTVCNSSSSCEWINYQNYLLCACRFKKKLFSVGVLSAVVAGLSNTAKAQGKNMWVLAIIDGPQEPKHVSALLEPVFLELQRLSIDGVNVYNAMTSTFMNVLIGPGVSSNDLPASAKLGAHAGHGAFVMCRFCWYRGSVCGELSLIWWISQIFWGLIYFYIVGCRSLPNEPEPPIWNNLEYSINGPTDIPMDPSCVERPKRRGEHIAWCDTSPIPAMRIKLEFPLRLAMAVLDKMQRSSDDSATAIADFCRENAISGWLHISCHTFRIY